ncbi:MAG: response regulator [Desulfobacterales bacterium]|nr:response regulator [Desulfobacterales bacterium]
MFKGTILFVDDEKSVLETLKKQVKNYFGNDYLYEIAESAQEAWDVIDEMIEDGQKICMIVSDWLMPNVKGDEFLINVHQKYPEIFKVILTGQADEESIEHLNITVNLHRYLRKPWDEKDLIEAIQSAIGDLYAPCNSVH